MYSMRKQYSAIGGWLLFCAVLVYLMIVVGGVTRLTESGLSMVQWQPIFGIFPPLNHEQWMAVFTLYKGSPEYLLINNGMDLSAFKQIFWWEYLHRILGRLIGVVYFLPLTYFWVKNALPLSKKPKLLMILVLGGLQGLLGWYMVKSGLVDTPHVSQYRLTAHLGLALLIFALLLWFALDFLRIRAHKSNTDSYTNSLKVLLMMVFIMMLSGGFVAGLKAGFIYNTFPSMDGQWLPNELITLQPFLRNFFENPVMVQFLHRIFAFLILFKVLRCFILARQRQYNTGFLWVVFFVILQISLGITTLLHKVPVFLGALHQFTAVALFSSVIFVLHRAYKR